MTLTKSDLVKIVSEHSELRRNEAAKFVEDFFEVIIRVLESGEPVKIPGFGNFILRDKSARIGRNPKTKEEFPISARRVVSFRTSNVLKSAVHAYDQEGSEAKETLRED